MVELQLVLKLSEVVERLEKVVRLQDAKIVELEERMKAMEDSRKFHQTVLLPVTESNKTTS